jgi:hypothetical protein
MGVIVPTKVERVALQNAAGDDGDGFRRDTAMEDGT